MGVKTMIDNRVRSLQLSATIANFDAELAEFDAQISDLDARAADLDAQVANLVAEAARLGQERCECLVKHAQIDQKLRKQRNEDESFAVVGNNLVSTGTNSQKMYKELARLEAHAEELDEQISPILKQKATLANRVRPIKHSILVIEGRRDQVQAKRDAAASELDRLQSRSTAVPAPAKVATSTSTVTTKEQPTATTAAERDPNVDYSFLASVKRHVLAGA